jgi:hypothetical protein
MTTTEATLALGDELRDYATLFIANDTDTTDINHSAEESAEEEGATIAEESIEEDPEEETVPAHTPTPTVPTSITVSRYIGDPDLVLNILETGIVIDGTFYDVAVIPSDRDAAVRFTVRNIGGTPSGAWRFEAHLPIEGDANYTYTSPTQPSLESGMQGEFILSFDDVLHDDRGTIEIRLLPENPRDRSANNVDVAEIVIDEE